MHSLKKTLSQIVSECSPPRFVPEGDRDSLPVHVWSLGEHIDVGAIKPHAPRPDQKNLAICFGGLGGLTMAAALNADAVLMLDANPFQPEMYKQVIFLLIRQCETASKFKATLQTHISTKDKDSYLISNGLGPDQSWKIRRAYSDAPSRPDLFFADPDLYARVRQIVQNGEVEAATLNVFDKKRCADLGKKLHKNGYAVTAIHTSNIGSSPDFYERQINETVTMPKAKRFLNLPEDIGTLNQEGNTRYPNFMEALFLLSDGNKFHHFHSDADDGRLADAERKPQGFINIESLKESRRGFRRRSAAISHDPGCKGLP